MAVYILENRATEIEFVPPERPASATVAIKDPSGTSLSTPTASVDAASATISSVTSSSELEVTASGTWRAGRAYWFVSAAGHEALVRCAEIDGTTLRLESPIATAVPSASDTFDGARVTATVPAIATRALHHRAEWTVTGADGVVRLYQQAIHVVRCLFRPAVLADEAARYLAGAFPSMVDGRPFGYFAELARRASARVERKLLAGGRYQHLVGDSAAFVDAGIVALRIELALEGLVPPGYDPTNYATSTEAELGNAIQEAISGLWYDEDDNGSFDTETEKRSFYSMRVVRR